jgi:Zn-dependent peptidase ImmA (M78 family)
MDRLSMETLLAIEEAEELASALADLRGAAPDLLPLSVPPAYQITDNPVAVASAERARIGFSVGAQLGWQGDREAFLRWRETIEAEGVFAYRLKLGDDDARGFAIWDDDRQIPVIAIDASEGSYGPKVFTLLHEYAHVLLRQGGVTTLSHSGRVERFCNIFAAFFLMPQSDFIREAGYAKRERDAPWTEAHVDRLAAKFKVSKSAVALHLQDIGLADGGFYDRMVAIWSVRNPASGGGRATHPEKMANRLGTRHIETVARALAERHISKLDAYELTNVKPEHFEQVKQEAQNRREAYGRPGRP